MRNRTTRTFIEVRTEIARLRESGLTWRAMAREHYPGIAEARMAVNLCAIYKHGREPHPNDIRRALGMAEYAPALVCAIHGVVHVSRRCPADNSKPRPKRRNWRGLALVLAGVVANRR